MVAVIWGKLQRPGYQILARLFPEVVFFSPSGNHTFISKYTFSRKLPQRLLTLDCEAIYNTSSPWLVAEPSRRRLQFYSCLCYSMTCTLCNYIFRYKYCFVLFCFVCVCV